MRNEQAMQRERKKLRVMLFSNGRHDTDWRTGFEHGVLQALTWALGMTDGKPTRGLELKLIGWGGKTQKAKKPTRMARIVK